MELVPGNRYLIDWPNQDKEDIDIVYYLRGGNYHEFGEFAYGDVVYSLSSNEVSAWVRECMNEGEVRSVSSTGGEKGVKLARFDLIPARAHRLLAEHYGRGANKYADHNWRRGYEWSKSIAALERHLNAFKDNEDYDEEMQSLHLVAVAWHAFTLIEAYFDHPEFDDRWKNEVKKEVDDK